MKKFMFTFLLTISFCKGADVSDSWTQAVKKSKLNIKDQTVLCLIKSSITVIPNNLDLPLLQELFLQYNEITAIPKELRLNKLQKLYLQHNKIGSINPKNILEQFPELCHLDLSNNPLTAKNVGELRQAATDRKLTIVNPLTPKNVYKHRQTATDQKLTIVADDVCSGITIKSAKRL